MNKPCSMIISVQNANAVILWQKKDVDVGFAFCKILLCVNFIYSFLCGVNGKAEQIYALFPDCLNFVELNLLMTLLKKIRRMIVFFMIALALSGITAFPVEIELRWLLSHPSFIPAFAHAWLQNVYNALVDTNAKYPMLAYGYDWLAFAHLVIATAFLGPYRDPVKNRWVIDWAIIACFAVFPLAFIAGPIRHIPMFHILIDCAFGVIGLIPLFICRKWIKQLEILQREK